QVLLGNRTGDVWTDLTRVVPAPHVTLTQTGMARYSDADGSVHLGARADIGDTPLAVWLEFPRTSVVAPAWMFIRGITVVGVFLIFVASAIIRVVTRRMTTPLLELANTAESIAGGDYARRAPGTPRRDEIGRLSGAFNVMADHVQATHERLQRRIEERTAALEALQAVEAALVESERTFRSTFDDAPLGIAQVSIDGTWIRVNRHLESILGWKAD